MVSIRFTVVHWPFPHSCRKWHLLDLNCMESMGPGNEIVKGIGYFQILIDSLALIWTLSYAGSCSIGLGEWTDSIFSLFSKQILINYSFHMEWTLLITCIDSRIINLIKSTLNYDDHSVSAQLSQGNNLLSLNWHERVQSRRRGVNLMRE